MNLYLIIWKHNTSLNFSKKKWVSKHSILPKGLDILIQKSFEKAEYYSKFACLSAINISLEKKIIEDYERIKEKILNEKDKIPWCYFSEK